MMKATFLLTAAQKGAKKIPRGLALAGVVMFTHQSANAVTIVDLQTASNFAILAGSAITDVQGPLGGTSTIVSEDVGVYPGTSNGLTASQVVGGAIYARPSADGLLLQAQNDLTTAYIDAGGRSVPGDNAFGDTDNQLGGKTLFPGVYSFGHAATANLIGTLTQSPWTTIP